MKITYFLYCLVVMVCGACLTSCATKDNPSDYHDQAVRKNADQEFESRFGY